MIASTISIEELGGLKRLLTLAGPSLPLRGTAWGSETRLKTKFPAGNIEAVQHVVGAAEAPTDFKGMWRTTQLIGTPAIFVDETGANLKITRASTMVQVFESIARGASLLRVIWASSDGRQILREGRIGPVKFPFDRFDDVAWECTFHWIGRGNTTSKIVQFKGEANEASVVAAIQAFANVLASVATDGIRSIDPTNDLSADDDSLGELESLNDGFDQASLATGIGASVSVGFGFGASAGFGVGANAGFGVGVSASASFGAGAGAGFMAGVQASASVTIGGIQASVVATAAYGADSVEFAGEAEAVGRSSTLQLNATLLLLGQTPPELLSGDGRPSSCVQATGYVWRTQKAVHKAAKAAVNVSHAARQRRSAADTTASRQNRASGNDSVTSYVAKFGETYSSIARRFYSDPEIGAVIAIANGDPSFRISPSPGKRLLIPVLSNSTPGM